MEWRYIVQKYYCKAVWLVVNCSTLTPPHTPMKKILLVTLVLSVASTSVFAQDDKKAILYAAGTFSFPSSDFADKDFDNDKSGLAEMALFGIDVSYARTFGSKPFGIIANIRSLSYPVDTDMYESELGREVGGTWTVASDNWSILSFNAGVYGTRPITERVSFDTKIMIGYAHVSFAGLTASGRSGSETVNISSEADKVFTFTYQVGAGLKFNINEKYATLFGVDYMGTKPKFTVDTRVSSNAGQTVFDTDSYEQPINAFTFSIGIGRRLK